MQDEIIINNFISSFAYFYFCVLMIKTILKILGILYFLGCIIIFTFQERLIFNAEQLGENYNYGMGQEIEIALDEEVSMNNLWVKSDKPSSKGVILYLHGNRGSIRFGTYQIRHFKNLGYDIMIPDYRSYGKTEGQICCEAQLLTDVEKVYDFLKTKYGESKITLVGYSLGTGFASYLASKNKPKQLLLIAPFTSLTDIKNKYLWFVPDFLLKFKFPVKKFLETTQCPITIVHGESDKIVDFSFSKKLKATFQEKINLVPVPNVGHRRIIFDRTLAQTIRDIF